MMRKDGQLTNLKAWRRGLRQMFGLKGFFTPTIPKLFDYFRPGFHPNDHDVAEALARHRHEMGMDLPASAAVH